MPRTSQHGPSPNTHGGKRPGAGAPKGNTNGLKHGIYSRRHLNAAILIAALPDLQVYVRRLLNEDPGKAARAHDRVLTAARHALMRHPALNGAIKRLVYYRLAEAAGRFDGPSPFDALLRDLSSNQDYVGILEELEARRLLKEGALQLHPDIDFLTEVITHQWRAPGKRAGPPPLTRPGG